MKRYRLQKLILTSICFASLALSSVVMARGSAESASVHIFSFQNGARLRYEFNGSQASQDSITFTSGNTMSVWSDYGTIGAFTLQDDGPVKPGPTMAIRRHFERVAVGEGHDSVFATKVRPSTHTVAVEFNSSTILIDDTGRTLSLPTRQDYLDLLTPDWYIGKEVEIDGQPYVQVFKSTFADHIYDEQWLINKANRSYGISYAQINRQVVESGEVRPVFANGTVRFTDKSNRYYADESTRFDILGDAEMKVAKMTAAKREDVAIGESIFRNHRLANDAAKSDGALTAPAPLELNAEELNKLKHFLASAIGIREDKFVYELLLSTDIVELRQHFNALVSAENEVRSSLSSRESDKKKKKKKVLTEAEFTQLVLNHPDLAPVLASVILKGLEILPAHPSKFSTPLQFEMAERLVRLSVNLRALPLTPENTEIKKIVLDRFRLFNLPSNDGHLRQRIPEVAEELDALGREVDLARAVLAHDFRQALKLVDGGRLPISDLHLVANEFIDRPEIGAQTSMQIAKALRLQKCIPDLAAE